MENEIKAMILLIILSFVIGVYAYPQLPENAASHWNASGDVDGYMPKAYAAFLLPALSVALLLVFLAIPLIDPLRANIRLFIKDYHRFCLVILAFLFLVYVQTILWNLGTKVSFSFTLPVLLGCLLFYLGHFLGKVKQNWFIGIRTPWTLSSPEVWAKTHQFGAKLFKGAGVLCVLSALFPAYSILVILGSVIVAALTTIAYSYVAYAGLPKK